MLHRRKFIGITTLAAASKISPVAVPALDSEPHPSPRPFIAAVDRPVENAIARIIETKVICKEPGRFWGLGTEYKLNINGHVVVQKKVMEPYRYLGWPTMVKTKGGELIVAFSGDRDGHVCPWGKTQIIRSRDNGATWSDPETVNNTPLDDRDAGLIQTNEGTLLTSWFTSLAFERPSFEAAYNRYARVGEKIDAETKSKWLGNWVRRSEDGGKTWLPPSRTVASAPHGPIQLRDGRQLYIGPGVWKEKESLVVEQSADDGRTWQVLTTIARPEGNKNVIVEPHLVELASGKIIAMFRHQPKDESQSFLLQSESNDGGKTWTPLHDTGILGYPPHLIQLKNNWLLVVYGFRQEPYSERACISRDEGRTWDTKNEIILTYAESRDLGYPASVQLDDGSILTVYYQAEKMGEPACLMTTHWNLK